MRFISVILVVLCCYSTQAFAESSVGTSLSASAVETGQTFRYEVTAATNGSAAIDVVKAPEFGDLTVLGQKRMPQFLSINGNVQRRLTLAYTLKAKGPGKVQIQGPTIRMDGELHTPEAQTVRIVPVGKLPKKSVPKASKDGSYMIQASIEPQGKVYVGQQLTLGYTLFIDARQMQVTPKPPDEPSLDDFWIENLSDGSSGRRQTVNMKGRIFHSTLLRNYALFPLKAGPAEIEPMGITLRSDGFFFRPGKETRIESQGLKFEVLPLPSNAPEDFYEGNVGKWRLSVRADTSATRVGSPITLDVTVSGEGQASRIRVPRLPDIDGLRIGEPSEETSTEIRANRVRGKRTLTYTLTPMREGRIDLPALVFSYFDPEQETYAQSRSNPLRLEIAPGELPPEPIEPSELTKRASSSTEDLVQGIVTRLPQPRTFAAHAGPIATVTDHNAYWVGLLALILLIVGLFAERPIRASLERSRPKRERKEKTTSLLAQLQTADSPEALSLTIRAFLKEVSGLSPGQISTSKIKPSLQKAGLGEDDAEALADILKRSDDARFSPSDADVLAGKDDAARILTKLASFLAVLLAFSFALPSLASTEDGHQAWADGDFAAAAQAFENDARREPAMATGWYNAALANAKAGEFAKARLYIEKASLRAPGDDEIDEVTDRLVRIIRLQSIEAERRSMALEGDEALFWWRLASQVDANVLPVLVMVLLLLLAIVLILRRQTGERWKQALHIASISLVVMVALSGLSWAARTQILDSVRPLIIIDARPDFREGPSKHSKKMKRPKGALPGVMLRELEARDDWVKVGVSEGHAWLPKSHVSLIN